METLLINDPINLGNSITIPALVIPGLMAVYNFIHALSLNDIIDYLYSGDISTILALCDAMGNAARVANYLAEGILDLTNDLHLSNINDSIIRYNNMVEVHRLLENVFDEVQRLLSNVEEFDNTLQNRNNIINPIASYIELLDEHGNELRSAGNLIVTAIRSLEDPIRIASPTFQFLAQLWFEA